MYTRVNESRARCSTFIVPFEREGFLTRPINVIKLSNLVDLRASSEVVCTEWIVCQMERQMKIAFDYRKIAKSEVRKRSNE